MRSGWFWFKESRYTTQLKKLRSVDAILEALFFGKWCPGAELNHRHLHFQCSALPTELPGRSPRGNGGRRSAGFIEARFPSVQDSRPPPHNQDASRPGLGFGAPSSSSSSLSRTALTPPSPRVRSASGQRPLQERPEVLCS